LFRILFVLVGSLATGALVGLDLPLWLAPIAATGIVLGAVAARRSLARRQAAGMPALTWRETAAFHSVLGWGVVCGQLAVALLRGEDLHLGQGNTLAIDNWMLGGAAVVAWLIVRPADRTRDERDGQIDALGARVGFWSLFALLVVASTVLGFAPAAWQERLTPFVIGNALIVLLLLGALAYSTAQLVAYWADARANEGAPEDAADG
jgi:hypothetical protein